MGAILNQIEITSDTTMTLKISYRGESVELWAFDGSQFYNEVQNLIKCKSTHLIRFYHKVYVKSNLIAIIAVINDAKEYCWIKLNP